MGLEKIVKDFDLFGIETHPIPPNPHGLRAKRTNPKSDPDTRDFWGHFLPAAVRDLPACLGLYIGTAPSYFSTC
jgi:hypothetical protein